MNKLKKIILVTECLPAWDGNGGAHRGYQIQWDCKNVCSNIETISLRQWRESFKEKKESLLTLFQSKWQKTKNKFLTHTNYSLLVDSLELNGFNQMYRKKLNQFKRNEIMCILDNPIFLTIASQNRQFGIPNILCSQNLESLVSNPIKKFNDEPELRMKDLAHELEMIKLCEKSFCISKVETGFISGLGLEAEYYPYELVGNIAAYFSSIKERRRSLEKLSSKKQPFLLILGSASHLPTKEGIFWLIQNIKVAGLPEKIKIIIAGKGTDKLSSQLDSPEVEFLGWVDTKKLEELLVYTEAVLVPYFMGFGTLTRLLELSYADIPIITSSHAMFSLDTKELKGPVFIAKKNWNDWKQVIERILNKNYSTSEHDIHFSRPSQSAIQKYLS